MSAIHLKSEIDPSFAWAPYEPGKTNPWTKAKVGHFYNRAAFGANWNELQEGFDLGPQKLVDRFIHPEEKQQKKIKDFYVRSNAQMRTLQKLLDINQCSAWWLSRMRQSPSPLQEKMALFWHNHFATSFAKVGNIGYMLGQYQTMHEHALGDFVQLLQAISKDPAMLIWLDTITSEKGKPNENYARELMELFSLGIGHYTEMDIRQAARAFTGWRVKDKKGVFEAKNHDDGEKTVFGKKGKFQGEQIVYLCLEQKACAEFLVRKFIRYFISEDLQLSEKSLSALIESLANQFRRDYRIDRCIETILRSNLFYSPLAYRQRIKSPVDFTVGMARTLESALGSLTLAETVELLGQNLFRPPSVKGWDGGTAWLNGQTILFRNQFANTMCKSRQPSALIANSKPKEDTGNSNLESPNLDWSTASPLPYILASKYQRHSLPEQKDFFFQLFFQGDLSPETRNHIDQFAEQLRNPDYPAHWSERHRQEYASISLCYQFLTLPEYQLN